MIDLKLFSLALSLEDKFGAVSFANLLKLCDNKIENVANFSPRGDKAKFYGDKIKSAINNIGNVESLVKKHNLKFVCLWEEDYPSMLKEIFAPPVVLFYKGNWDLEKINNSISIVGTRNMSEYGRSNAYKFSKTISENGFSIVSGMAIGIDKQAHLGAIDSNAYTVAVLSSNVNEPSPRSNSDVYKKILDSGGLIISEFSPEVEINPGMFAQRNKIVAGISKGTLVIEAQDKSGALITADLALEYGRDVFSLPGNTNNIRSVGTNKLIRDGKAKLVLDPSDVLIEYNQKILAPEEKSILDNLTKVEHSIYDLLSQKAYSIEDIILQLSLDLKTSLDSCFELELKNLIFKDKVGRYQIK